ncbi:hypothetical protein BG004_007007 [Podila humilis]|nr:hypothetical protein BG004_007007 [Podila humilis]
MTMFKQSGQTPRQQGQNADQGKQAQQIQQQFDFRRQQPMVLEGGFAGTPQASNQLPGTFPNLSEAFDDGVNIPTEFFNTENFGTVAVPPLGATGATGAGTSTGPTNLTNSMAADAQFTISSDDDGFDDLGELDLPADFEDDIDMESKDLPMTQHISEGNIYGFMTQDQASQRASVHRNPPMDPTRSASSAALLAVEEENHRIKMQLEEMTKEIEVVRKEAQRKAGENSILKENGEKAARELRAANDKLRETEMTAAQEISKMRELHNKEMKNQQMAHQFDFEKNTKLEALSQRCVQVLTGLTLHVHEDAIVKSLAVTTSLLQRSIKLRKPLHTGNALRILRILYTQYSSVAKQVCKGSVPFLEMATEDPLEATLAWDKLPSALACIYYLLITRFAQCWPSAAADLGVPDSQAQWGPTSPKCLITFVKVPANARIRSSWISMDTQNPLNHKHFAAFDEDIFALVENIIRDQLRSGLSGKVVPLAHWRVFDNVLLLHRKNISTVCRTLSVLEIISQDPDSCHFYCGWSKRGLKWTNSFKQLETLAEIMNLSSQNDSELAVSDSDSADNV